MDGSIPMGTQDFSRFQGVIGANREVLPEVDTGSNKPALTKMLTQDGEVEVIRVPLIDTYKEDDDRTTN